MALTLFCLFVLRDALTGERLYSLYEDNEFLLGPVFSQIARAFASGELPLRMEAVLGGFPLYNFTQATPYYPLYGFFLGGYETHPETVYKLHRLTVLHVVIGVLAMYYLLRSIGLVRVAAVAGAVMYGLSADMASYKLWLNIIAPYAWLPLFVAGLIGILTGMRVRLNVALCSLSAAMIALASPAQPLIHAVLVALVLCAAFVASAEARSRFGRGSIGVATVGAAGLVAVLICAPVLFPPLFDADKMIRWIGAFPAALLSEKIPFEAFVHHKLPVARASAILISGDELRLVGHPYIGFFALPLVLLAFAFRRTWIVYAFGVLALYGVWSAFGDDLGLAYANHAIPLVNKIREPTRSLVLFQFGCAVLAAIGIANLARPDGAGPRERNRAAVALLFSGAICTLFYLWTALAKGATRVDTGLFVGALILHAATIHFLRRKDETATTGWLASAWATGAVINLVVAVSWTPPLRFSDSLYVRKDMAPIDAALRFIAQQPGGSEHRVLFDGKFEKGYAAMLGAYSNVRTFDYYINPAPLKQAVAVSYGYSPYYLHYGAGYLVCQQCDLSKYPGFELLQRFGDLAVLRNGHALGRHYVGHIVDDAADGAEFERKVAKIGAMPARPAVYIERNAVLDAFAPAIARAPTAEPCTVTLLKATASEKSLSVGCSAGQVLVLNEFNDGNWVATMNGKRHGTIVANGHQVGVVLTGTTQVVTFEYRPMNFFWSLTMVPVGVLVLLLLLSWSRSGPERNGKAR